MAKRVTLYTREFLTGKLDVNLSEIELLVMDSYRNKRFMSSYEDSIRAEDVRVSYTRELQRVVKTLESVWHKEYGTEIELCWQVGSTEDPNSAIWAVVHGHNQSTNLHSHETSENYHGGAHVSAAFWVKVPPDSGDLVFQYHTNPYIIEQTTVKAEAGKFAMFDSTLPHFVTRNLSDDYRIVISMNFRIKPDK